MSKVQLKEQEQDIYETVRAGITEGGTTFEQARWVLDFLHDAGYVIQRAAQTDEVDTLRKQLQTNVAFSQMKEARFSEKIELKNREMTSSLWKENEELKSRITTLEADLSRLRNPWRDISEAQTDEAAPHPHSYERRVLDSIAHIRGEMAKGFYHPDKEPLEVIMYAAEQWQVYELRCLERAMKENNND